MSEDVRTVSPDDLARLKADRDAADARYNAALTALDQAIQRVPPLPHPPPGPDETQITPLNQGWQVTTAVAQAAGWRGRFASAVWRVIAPVVEAQERFNATLVDHVNRSLPRERAVAAAIDATIGLAKAHIEESIRFQSQLILYLQTITPFVDTKDYEFAGLARRATEDVVVTARRLDDIARGLAAGLSAIADDGLRRAEAAAVTDQRRAAALDELRTAVAAARETAAAVQREVERLGAGVGAGATQAGPAPSGTTPDGAQQLLAHDRLRSHHYAGFEDAYRGSEDDIRDRLADYAAHFAGATDVVDLGCGRGEFLEVLRARGIPARGVDLNATMVERCRAKGLDVVQGDAAAFLAGLAEHSLGGLMASQVVEHLQPDDLLRLLELSAARLRPGGVIVLETINPTSWSAFFDSYVRDLTHVRPVHPDTLRHLLIANGFADVQVLWRSPYPAEAKLARVPAPPPGSASPDPRLDAVAAAVDRTVERLNGLLFAAADYAVVGRRPIAS